jgi:uncharacterized protein involved in type VI secretion and phage assembly
MPPGSGDFQLISTRVNVEGENNDVVFSSLVIDQQLADVGSFSFIWRLEEGEVSLSNHISFYQRALSKEVTIHIGDNYTFKGFICTIKCINEHVLGSEYEITGKGLFAKLDHVKLCNSFSNKTISQIFHTLNTANGTRLSLAPNHSSELLYNVQYNRTTFDYYKMLATGLGEWLYYTGTELRLGNPNSSEHVIHTGQDIDDVRISSSIAKSSFNATGFDRQRGEVIQKTQNSRNERSGLIDAGVQAGEHLFPNDQGGINVPRAGSSQTLDFIAQTRSKAIAAATVQVMATTHVMVFTLGDKIKIMDENNRSAGEYYVTEVRHSCENETNYSAKFMAVPTEVDVPPYTDTDIPSMVACYEQAAIITDNDDPDGFDRVKVRFPWQPQSDSTPWINVVVPYAGKQKGFRFIPEIDEEVMVAFLENNPNKPYVTGAFHTERNKSEHPHEGNHVKILSSKDGRRLEINDDLGTMKLMDNYSDKQPFNALFHKRKDSDVMMWLESVNDDNALSTIQLNNGDSLKIGVKSGGDLVTQILLESSGNKITIKSKGTVEIDADQQITMSSGTINIKASQDLNLEGTNSGVSIKGMKVAIDADTNIDAKAQANATFSGSAQAELKSSGIVSVTGSLVKIN